MYLLRCWSAETDSRYRGISSDPARRAGPHRPRATELRYPDRSPAIETIIAQVAEDFGVAPNSLLYVPRGRRTPNIARAVAMYVARNPGGHTLTDIAAAFRLAHYTGLVVTIKRLHARMAEDQALAHRIHQLAVQLSKKEIVKI